MMRILLLAAALLSVHVVSSRPINEPCDKAFQVSIVFYYKLIPFVLCATNLIPELNL